MPAVAGSLRSSLLPPRWSPSAPAPSSPSRGRTTRRRLRYSAADRILHASDAQTFVDTRGSKATFVRSLSKDGVVIVPTGMKPAPDGKAYVLWLQHDNKMVARGGHGRLRQALRADRRRQAATGGAVSIEDAGTTPDSPSDQVAALYDFDA